MSGLYEYGRPRRGVVARRARGDAGRRLPAFSAFDDEFDFDDEPLRRARPDSIAEEMAEANRLIRDLHQRVDEEVMVKRHIAAVLHEVLVERARQTRAAESEEQQLRESRLEALTRRAQNMYRYAVRVRENEKTQFQSDIAELLGIMSLDYIQEVFWSVLDNGIHDSTKFILLLCCLRLPRSRARNGLLAACTNLDMSAIDLDTLAFWLSF